MVERLRIENVAFGYGPAMLFENLFLAVRPGEVLAIVGESGSGKSTLLQLCAALCAPAAGRVLWRDLDVREYSRRALTRERGTMGYLFQTHALIHNYPVFDNLALPLHRHFNMSENEIRDRIMSWLDRLALRDIARKLPDMLSRGEAQCVALARALVAEPDLVLLDEPTSSLDPVKAERVVNALKEYRSRTRATFIMISHNAFLLKEMACSMKILDRGHLYDHSELGGLAAPEIPRIATLLGEMSKNG